MSIDEAGIGQRVLARRQAMALSQDELARRARVSRQTIGALEAGKHLPRVDAAIRIAEALATTVEALMSQRGDAVVGVTGDAPSAPNPVRAIRVGDTVVALDLAHPSRGETLLAPNAVVEQGQVFPFAGADTAGLLVVGCDPLGGLVADMSPARGRSRIHALAAKSVVAKKALKDGRAHVALVHDRTSHTASTETGDLPVQRLPLSQWQVGLAFPKGRARVLADALAGCGPVIQREADTATQRTYRRHLDLRGIADAPSGPVASGHLDAARQCLGAEIAAVTMEPAARILGLDFYPLEEHTSVMWIADHAADHPAVRMLRDQLTSAGLRARVAALPGYQLADAL